MWRRGFSGCRALRFFRCPPLRWCLRGGCCSVRCPDAQLWLSTSKFARNSSMTHSNIGFTSLELQRFWGISKNDRYKLRAKFIWRWCGCRPLRPSALLASIGALARCPAPPPTGPAARPSGLSGTLHADGGGVCSIRGWLSACRRRVGSLMTPFPPFGGGEAATWVDVLAKVQTHWVKNSENRSL